MIFPEFIKKGDTIGICAPSAGIGNKIEDYETSIAVLNKEGYKVKETASVRSIEPRSASAVQRVKELEELVCDPEIKMIMTATGGDVQMETIDLIDYEKIRKHPKWIMGYSDPTNLLFPVTTALDIATIYGFNGASYNDKHEQEQINNLSIIKGDLVKQHSFEKYQDFLDVIKENEVYKDVAWKADGPLEIKGRCIGGCLDVIMKLIGTRRDHVNEFIGRYKDDGIVWYFDNFAINAYNVYLSLLQFKSAGWFRYCKGVLFGRPAFPDTSGSDVINDYEVAYRNALGEIPYISEMDIGHSKPRMTMINGALIEVHYKDNKGDISFLMDGE